jgi:glucose/arabinose dehydrogenase
VTIRRARIFTRLIASIVLLFATQFALQSTARAAATPPAIPPNTPGVQYAFPELIGGFDKPVFITHAGDSRLFVVEQSGKIRIVKNGQVLPTPFLDLGEDGESLIECCGEQGLLGLAFEPNYSQTGRFYVYYTQIDPDDTDGDAQIIARYNVSSNPDIADPNSDEILLEITHNKHSNHNGGWLGFGPHDQLLYIATGDGGSGGDPDCNGMDPNTVLGKILRINVIGQISYTVPTSNTFTASQDPLVWAFGLRNPWRNSFDRGDSSGNAKGDFYMGDVGQGAYEEISYQPREDGAGKNFGWNKREGMHDYSNACPNPSGIALTEPIAEYGRSLGTSITGGYVYRGNSFSWLRGTYFYADFSTGGFFTAWKPSATAPFQYQRLVNNVGFNVSSFGEDVNGELYLANYSGKIHRFQANLPYPARAFLPLVRR